MITTTTIDLLAQKDATQIARKDPTVIETVIDLTDQTATKDETQAVQNVPIGIGTAQTAIVQTGIATATAQMATCLLYTSDAADE